MSTSRLDPRERVEQSQLAAALAASRQVGPTPQQPDLPPPSATKYGDLGSGTLLTTTTETTTTPISGSALRKGSDDRSGLLSSLNGDLDSISKSNERGPTTPRMLSSSSTRPSARAPKRLLIEEDGDLSLPPAAPLNGAAQASGLGSALRTDMPVANDTIMAADTAEVIGDSDEESRPSSHILSDVSQRPAEKPVERASTATSSIVDPTASSAVPGPSKPSKASRTSDPITTTTTTTSSSSRTNSASNKKTSLQGFDLEIVVAPNPPRRTFTAASKSGASAKSKTRDSINSKASKKCNAESSDDTDYDTLPGEKATKKTGTLTRRKETDTTGCGRGSSKDLDHDDDAALPRKKNRTRTSTIIRDSSPPRLVKNGAEEEMPVSDASEDPLLIRANDKSESAEQQHGGALRPPKGRRPIAVEDSEEEGTAAGGDDTGRAAVTGGDDAGSSAPRRNGPPRRGGTSDSRRVAVSEDEDGAREAQEAALRALEQADEMDDDYGGPGRKTTKKGKAAAKKRVRTGSKRGAEGDEVAAAGPSKSELRRPPTITKDDVPVKKDPPASSSVSPETTRSGRPSRNKPKRLGTSFVNESPIRRAAPAPPPVPAIHGKLPPLPSTGDSSSTSLATGASEQAVFARTASKKRSIVHDSEEEDDEHVGARESPKPAEGGASSAVAGESAPRKLQTGGEHDQPATTAGIARRGKSKQRKQIVPSSDAEDEGAASDATSAIATGDEFSDDDEPEKATRGGKKGKEVAGPARADSTASKSSTTRLTANKRPRLSTSPNRARGRSASTEERIEQMMKAAAGDEEQSLLKPASRSSTAKGAKKAAKGVVTGEEEEEEEKAPTSDSEADSKENEGSAIRKTGNENGTPVAARARSASGTPFSKAPRPGSLAAIMAKKGLATFRAPGLSAKQRVPPLHTNLKPPPPAKKALPEKKVKRKKGDESYSDEEKPWYKRKDPEEWDDEDHRRWQKRLRRIDRGLPPDSDDD